MADHSAQGEDEKGNMNLKDIPENRIGDPSKAQVPLYARNRPTSQSLSGASINSCSSAAVFGRSTRCTLNQIIQDKVIVQKVD